jgi:hypothetical protein
MYINGINLYVRLIMASKTHNEGINFECKNQNIELDTLYIKGDDRYQWFKAYDWQLNAYTKYMSQQLEMKNGEVEYKFVYNKFAYTIAPFDTSYTPTLINDKTQKKRKMLKGKHFVAYEYLVKKKYNTSCVKCNLPLP